MLSGKLLDLGWERVALSHTAHVDASLDLEESIVTPVSSPGVFDDPVVNTVFGSVSNGDDSVVDIGWGVLAYVRGVYSTGVVSESIDDLEGNGDWALRVDSESELILISLSDVERALLDGNSKGRLINSAVSILSVVRVSLLSADTAGVVNVLEGVGRKTSIATVVVKVSGAINQLLLGEAIERSIVDQ